MTIPDHKFDYEEEGRDRLLVSILRQPSILALVRFWTIEAQKIEDLTHGLLMSLVLSSSSGRLLDLWGRLVGEERGGLLDGDYRSFIEARILSNTSSGTMPEMIAILALITGAIDVQALAVYPAGVVFSFTSSLLSPTTTLERVREHMEQVAPAGVLIHWISEVPETPFGFLDDSSSLGFGEGGLAGTI